MILYDDEKEGSLNISMKKPKRSKNQDPSLILRAIIRLMILQWVVEEDADGGTVSGYSDKIPLTNDRLFEKMI